MKRNLHTGAGSMVSQSVLIISKVSQCFSILIIIYIIECKIVDIYIYILFLISSVSHILLDILWKIPPSLTLSANGNYMLGYNFQQRCLHPVQLRLYVLYYWHDMIHMRKSGAYYSVIDHLKNWDRLKFGEKADLNAF